MQMRGTEVMCTCTGSAYDKQRWFAGIFAGDYSWDARFLFAIKGIGFSLFILHSFSIDFPFPFTSPLISAPVISLHFAVFGR